jgi:hypothetical protein
MSPEIRGTLPGIRRPSRDDPDDLLVVVLLVLLVLLVAPSLRVASRSAVAVADHE